MKIGVASDHRGFVKKEKIKKYLIKKGFEVKDYGTNSKEKTDFPEYAFKVGQKVMQKEVDYGVLFCGTGIGVSIAANKVKGIRCAKINNKKEAKLAKIHNNVNVLAFGAIIRTFTIKDSIDMFFKSEYKNNKNYSKRNQDIANYESNNSL